VQQIDPNQVALQMNDADQSTSPPPEVRTNGGTDNGEAWTTQKTATLYQIQGWGTPYFSVSDNGHVTSKRAASTCRS
jgi:arginine decarboxylase-like protein